MNEQARKPVIGLIGGVGSGKSFVARALARRGCVVIDGDQIGHATLRDADIRARVVERWGAGVLGPAGEVERRKLAAIVFRDRAELAELERIMHPRMGREIGRRIAEAQARPEVRLIVLDAAVLLEAGWAEFCDRVIYVDAPRAERLARVHAERGWGPDELDRREGRQLPLPEKRRRSDEVLDSSGSPAQTEARVAAWLDALAGPPAGGPDSAASRPSAAAERRIPTFPLT